MKKQKTITKRQFESLPQEQQAKELKKMAKRANVRISLLEETGIQNKSYYDALDYNMGKGKLHNRFYEGTNYKTQSDAKQAFSALSNFLNNKTSTLGGIEEETQNKVKDLIKKGQFDFNTLSGLTEKERIYVSKEASRQANRQLKELEKADLTKFAYEVANHYNEATGRDKNRFYTGGKFKKEKDLNVHIQNVAHYLNLKSASVQGYKDMDIKRIATFREKGINIAEGQEQDFLDFLSSKQFESLKKYAESTQLIPTFAEARKAGKDVDTINKQFEDFLNSNLTFDEVQEKLEVAKWKEGGLLH